MFVQICKLQSLRATLDTSCNMLWMSLGLGEMVNHPFGLSVKTQSGWWFFFTPLKNMSSAIGMIRNSQYEWENKIDGNQTTNQIWPQTRTTGPSCSSYLLIISPLVQHVSGTRRLEREQFDPANTHHRYQKQLLPHYMAPNWLHQCERGFLTQWVALYAPFFSGNVDIRDSELPPLNQPQHDEAPQRQVGT